MTPEQEAIALLRSSGVSLAAIGRAVDRSPRFLRFIAQGEKPAPASVAAALRSLTTTGEVVRAERRHAASGELARVRAPRTAGVPSVRPAAAYTPVTHVARGGGFLGAVDVAGQSKRGANDDLAELFYRASLGRKQLRMTVVLKDGTRVELFRKGGISASRRGNSGGVWSMVKNAYGGDALGWVAGQASEQSYGDDDIEPNDIASVELSAY